MIDISRLQPDSALLAGDHEAAVRGYVGELIAATEAAGSGRAFPDVAFNLTLARRRWRRGRQGAAPRIAVCGWEMGHNAAGRVQTLAELHATTGAAEVAMIGALFPKWGSRLWGPLEPPGFPCHLLKIEDPAAFPRQALEFVRAHPFEIVHLSKPRMPNILFGLFYKLIWDAHVILDIDDEELAVVNAEAPLALSEIPRGSNGLPDWSGLTGKVWTQIAVGLARQFTTRSVSSAALQKRYGGLILPHARDAERFAKARAERLATRAALGLPPDAQVVLFFGTVRRHKGVLELARALKALGRRDLCLAVIGEIADPDLRAELEALAGPDLKLHVHPMQPYARAAKVVAVGDICVLLQDPTSPIAQNQLPAKLVDALAGGLAVLATPTPALEDLIQAGAVRPISTETLTAELNRCLEDPDGMAALRARGQKVFVERMELTAQAPVLAALGARPTPQPPGQPLPEELAGILEALGGFQCLLRPSPDATPRSAPKLSISAPPPPPRTDTPSSGAIARNGESWAGVDIVVPVYNALEDVRACLESLVRVRSALRQRLILVNDGSDADTSRMLRDFAARPKPSHIRVDLIEHSENRGYTKAVNTGLRASTAPFSVTQNSDTIVTDEWLEGLIRCMRSDPSIGICGPLSNAASWQNVPHLYGSDKAFAINALPEGMTADDMAAVIRSASERSYPRTTFVNGFCFMIRRDVIERIGYMDEDAFPLGYGEENDFCIRAQDAGFALAYADDVYVFHAKSKSFGSERKKELSKSGSNAIHRKHGSEKFNSLVAKVKKTDAMDAVRTRVQAALAKVTADPLAARNAARGPVIERMPRNAPRIGFLLPVRGGGGGAHSVVQEVAELRQLGVDARVLVRFKYHEEFKMLYGDIPDSDEIFLPFSDRTRTDLGARFDVIAATIFTSVKLLAEIVEAHPKVQPAYYVQDYEPWFFPPDNPLHEEALRSYTLIEGCLLFAKTDWIRNQVAMAHGVHVTKVSPSIDHQIYRPQIAASLARKAGPVRLTAMIRPRTPRRGAARTMDLFARLHAELGDRVALSIFGCAADDPDFGRLRRDFPFSTHGILRRPEVAALLQQTDIFVDLSDYQAFGRTALEAMACGATALVPQVGGGDEYAVDGVNALVANTLDVAACKQALSALIDQSDRLQTMQLAALQTAAAYSSRRAAASEVAALLRACA